MSTFNTNSLTEEVRVSKVDYRETKSVKEDTEWKELRIIGVKQARASEREKKIVDR